MTSASGFWDETEGARRFFPACDHPSSTRRFVTANGVRLWVEEEGRGSPLLLIHGGPGVDHRSLHPGLSVLSSSHRLVYFDLRGHYMSSSPGGKARYGPDIDADDAAALIRALDLAHVFVLGHSYGGIVALSLAARHPRLVDRAVITSCPVGQTEEEVELRLKDDPRSEAAAGAGTERERDEHYLEFYYFRRPDRVTREYALLVKRSYGIRKNRRMLAKRESRETDWRALLSAVACPVLFLYGREDPIVCGKALERATSSMPDSTALAVEESRHELFSDQPWEFRRLVRRFLSGE